MVHVQLAARKQVLRRLVKQESQRPDVHQTRRVMGQVEKLDIPAIVDAKLQSLRHVVDLGRNDGLRLLELKFRQHL